MLLDMSRDKKITPAVQVASKFSGTPFGGVSITDDAAGWIRQFFFIGDHYNVSLDFWKRFPTMSIK